MYYKFILGSHYEIENISRSHILLSKPQINHSSTQPQPNITLVELDTNMTLHTTPPAHPTRHKSMFAISQLLLRVVKSRKHSKHNCGTKMRKLRNHDRGNSRAKCGKKITNESSSLKGLVSMRYHQC